MHDLKRRAAAYEQKMSIQRKLSVEERAADYFVDRVVPPNVLPNKLRFSISSENSGGVNSASAREFGLTRAQLRWERKECFNVDPERL